MTTDNARYTALLDQGLDVKITVVSAAFARHGYRAEAELEIQPGMGRYVVTLWLTKPDGASREVAWEPSEPERRDLALRWAATDPEAAVLDAIQIDRDRRQEDMDMPSE